MSAEEKCFNCGRKEGDLQAIGRGVKAITTHLNETEIGGRFTLCCQRMECRRVLHDEQDGANGDRD